MMFVHAFISITQVSFWLKVLQVHVVLYIQWWCHLLACVQNSYWLLIKLVDVLVVHIQILYYTGNILLLPTKQNASIYTHDVNNMVIIKQMMMHINWLMELYADIRMLGGWLWCWWSCCMCCDYMWCMIVCQPIWFSYDSAISHPCKTVMVLNFVINIPVDWYPFFTNFMFIIFFNFSMITVQFIASVECSWVGLFMNNGPLFMLLLLLLLLLMSGCLSSCVKVSSNGSVFVCFCSWS